MECYPTRGYFFNNAYYLRISTEQQNDPSFVTDVFEFDEVNFSGVNNEKIMFVISKSQSEVLYSRVKQAEHAVALMIRNMSEGEDKFFPSIPQVCKDIFNQHHMTSSLVRSNYWAPSNGEEVYFYLKGNVSNIVITDFSDNPIDAKQLGQGKYQFEIKANLLYFGEHVDKTCMVNLQLRISRIRFTPLTSILENDTSYDESKWNPLPPPEMTKFPLLTTPQSTRKKRVAGAPKKTAKRNCIPSE